MSDPVPQAKAPAVAPQEGFADVLREWRNEYHLPDVNAAPLWQPPAHYFQPGTFYLSATNGSQTYSSNQLGV